jgi:hypothetical protein
MTRRALGAETQHGSPPLFRHQFDHIVFLYKFNAVAILTAQPGMLSVERESGSRMVKITPADNNGFSVESEVLLVALNAPL